MNIPTTQRRFWLLAAIITSLASEQALSESKVDVRLKKRAARPVACCAGCHPAIGVQRRFRRDPPIDTDQSPERREIQR